MSRRFALVLQTLVVVATAVGGTATAEDFDLIEATVGSWVECSLRKEPSACLEERTVRQLRTVRAELGGGDPIREVARTGKNLPQTEEEEEEPEVKALAAENEKIARRIEEENKSEPQGLIEEIGEFFAGGILRFFDDVFDLRERDGDSAGKSALEGRGHKKKYLKKQNKHLKLILILMLIKNKIKMFLHKFQFLIQLKFLGIAVANLLVNLVRLWLELKKKHKPNKVIYYEKSHHQHHYDNEHITDDDDHYTTSYKHHGYGHHEEEDSGGIWPWSRNYVEHRGDMWGNPPFRHPGSHNLVYMNQRPIR